MKKRLGKFASEVEWNTTQFCADFAHQTAQRRFKCASSPYVYRRDVMTQWNAQISRENLPVPLKLEKIIIH